MSPALHSFINSLRCGRRNAWRDAGLGNAALALFAGVLFAQTPVMMFLGAEGWGASLHAESTLTLELPEQVSDQKRSELYAALRQLPEVERMTYVTGEQRRKQEPSAFRDLLQVTPRSAEGRGNIVQFLGQERWRLLLTPAFFTQAQTDARRLASSLQLREMLRFFALLLLPVSIAALVLLLTETLRRRSASRGKEMEILHLLGAPAHSLLSLQAAEGGLLLVAPLIAIAGALFLLTLNFSSFSVLSSSVFFFLEFLLVPLVAVAAAWLSLRVSLSSLPVAPHAAQ